MRNSFIALALGSLLACGIAAAPAQDNPQSQDGGHRGRGRDGMNPDRELERLTQQLGLSSDQQAQIRPILVDRQQKMQALMQNQSLSEQDRHQQMRGIAEASRAGIKAVLTDEQKQKFDAMREHGRGGPEGQGGPPDGQAPPQPQQ